MAQLHATAERIVAVAPAAVFAAIADYADRHRRALPDAYHDYTVEEGGQGDGTVVRWTLHVGSHRRPYRMRVTEPRSGEHLVEQDSESSFATHWRVLPEGSGARIVLSSTWEQRSSGFPALFERLFAPRSLARLHAQTLQRLERVIGDINPSRRS